MELTPHAPNPADDDSPSAGPVTAVRMPEGVLSMDGAQRWVLTGVAPAPEGVAHVRGEAHLVLHWWSLDDLSWTVELLLSELAGNVVRHAGTPYDVTMTWDRHTLRVCVRDASAAPPQPRVQIPEAESEGRGLLLVTNLATRWGWEPVAHGKVVWFELVPLRPDGIISASDAAPGLR
jgi:anti-sigma regulatory factor (Ser/Thr protein kinase)